MGCLRDPFELDGAGLRLHPHEGLEVVAQYICVVGGGWSSSAWWGSRIVDPRIGDPRIVDNRMIDP